MPVFARAELGETGHALRVSATYARPNTSQKAVEDAFGLAIRQWVAAAKPWQPMLVKFEHGKDPQSGAQRVTAILVALEAGWERLQAALPADGALPMQHEAWQSLGGSPASIRYNGRPHGTQFYTMCGAPRGLQTTTLRSTLGGFGLTVEGCIPLYHLQMGVPRAGAFLFWTAPGSPPPPREVTFVHPQSGAQLATARCFNAGGNPAHVAAQFRAHHRDTGVPATSVPPSIQPFLDQAAQRQSDQAPRKVRRGWRAPRTQPQQQQGPSGPSAASPQAQAAPQRAAAPPQARGAAPTPPKASVAAPAPSSAAAAPAEGARRGRQPLPAQRAPAADAQQPSTWTDAARAFARGLLAGRRQQQQPRCPAVRRSWAEVVSGGGDSSDGGSQLSGGSGARQGRYHVALTQRAAAGGGGRRQRQKKKSRAPVAPA